MGKHFSLSQMRERYFLGKMDKKQLEGSIFQYLLKSHVCNNLCGGNPEQWSDFLSWLYPRISRAIDVYRDTGSSFDSYLITMVHWSYKEYRNKEVSHQATEYSWWCARAEELSAYSPEPEYLTGILDGPGTPKEITEENDEDEISQSLLLMRNKLSPRQILLLLLKSYYFVSPGIIKKVARHLRIREENIYKLIDTLHTMRMKREQEILEIISGMQCQYYRCLVYEKRLMYAMPESALYEKLRLLLERARRRFRRMKKRLSGIRFDATNGQIAEALHIPKGTVDSAFYSIRKKSELCGFTWEKPLYSKGGENNYV